MNKFWLYFVGVAVVMIGLFLTGSARSVRAYDQNHPYEVDVEVKEYTVEMSTTNLPAGIPIKFNITNHGTVAHEAVLELANSADQPLEIEGEEAEIEDINPGETKSAIWKISDSGEYQLACHVPGHYEGGMVMTFAVNPIGLAGVVNQPLFWVLLSVFLILAAAVVSFIVLRRPKPAQPVTV